MFCFDLGSNIFQERATWMFVGFELWEHKSYVNRPWPSLCRDCQSMGSPISTFWLTSKGFPIVKIMSNNCLIFITGIYIGSWKDIIYIEMGSSLYFLLTDSNFVQLWWFLCCEHFPKSGLASGNIQHIIDLSLTLSVREPSYFGLIRSISWLLMPCWLIISEVQWHSY